MKYAVPDMKDIDKDCILFEQAKAIREPRESYWKDLYKYSRPNKDDITYTRSSGERLAKDVYNDAAIQAITVSAAGMHGYLTNPAQRWFTLDISDRKLAENREVKIYLKEVEEELYSIFGHSNLDTELPEIYTDLLSIGCADLYEEPDDEDVVRFYANPMAEIYFMENDKKVVDKVFRAFKYSTIEMYEKFGEAALPKEVKDAFKSKKYTQQFDVLHVCRPRDMFDPNMLDSINMPYASRWIFMGKNKKRLKEGGYRTFPHFCPRFYRDRTGPYGVSPLMFCFPSVQLVQGVDRSLIIGTEKHVNPGMIMPHKNFLKPFRNRAGAMNYDLSTDPNFAGKQIQFLGPQGNIPIGENYLSNKEQRIRATLFAELFLFIASSDGSQKTAFEVNARINEGLLLLGTVIGGLKRELLTPKINRTYELAAAAGRLPDLPTALEGQSFFPRFTSPLAKASTSVEQGETINYMNLIAEMQAYYPEARDILNVDYSLRRIHSLKSIDPKMLNSEEDVQKDREIRQAGELAQAQQEAAANAANTAKMGSEAEKNLRS